MTPGRREKEWRRTTKIKINKKETKEIQADKRGVK
jgi:hypothetical protein